MKEEIKGACVLRVNGNAYQFCRLFYQKMKIPMMNKCVYCYFTLLTILVRLIKSVGAFRGSLTGAVFCKRRFFDEQGLSS